MKQSKIGTPRFNSSLEISIVGKLASTCSLLNKLFAVYLASFSNFSPCKSLVASSASIIFASFISEPFNL